MKPYLLSCAALALVCSALVACGDKGGVVGTYTIDLSSMRSAAIEEAKKNFPPGTDLESMKPVLEAGVDAMLKGIKMTMELKGDKTWTMKMDMDVMGRKQNNSAAGTWKQDGDKIWITATEEDGQKKSGEEPKALTLKDGKLTFEAQPGMTIVLVKK